MPFYLQLYSFLCDVFSSIESDAHVEGEMKWKTGCDAKTCAIKWYHFSSGIREIDISQGLW